MLYVFYHIIKIYWNAHHTINTKGAIGVQVSNHHHMRVGAFIFLFALRFQDPKCPHHLHFFKAINPTNVGPKASSCQPRLLQGFQDSIKPLITMQATNDHRMGHLAHLVFQRLIYYAKGIHGLLQPPEPHKRTSKGQDIFCGDARSSSGVP